MVKIINHRFKNRKITKGTKILILGTFNPEDTKKRKGPDFFYGRSRNHLWRLLPEVFGEKTLKKATKKEKEAFAKKYKIAFCDLILKVEVPLSQAGNVDDKYIDRRVKKWADLKKLISTNPSIKKVYLTRKTFQGIKNIKQKVDELQDFLHNNRKNIYFLYTPARSYNKKKLREWKKVFKLK